MSANAHEKGPNTAGVTAATSSRPGCLRSTGARVRGRSASARRFRDGPRTGRLEEAQALTLKGALQRKATVRGGEDEDDGGGGNPPTGDSDDGRDYFS